ncbi:MAG: hypothetical protein BM556_05605 [Bacteriovorax sp. MedPE-SWde]|nr:MAG: hypothetical protein BM556_05605 [Bacteriovorax sp. MedPE-SWde]
MGLMKSYIGREHMLVAGSVCWECFENEGIQNYIKENYNGKDCDYCSRENKSYDLSEVIDFVYSCLRDRYENPANGMGYNSREGGYQGQTYDSHEILDEVGLGCDCSSLFEDVANNLPEAHWCKIDPYQLWPHEEVNYDWQNFSNLLKHKCRFHFLHHGKKHDDYFSGEPKLLSSILEYIVDTFIECSIVKKIPVGHVFHRARYFDENHPFDMVVGEIAPPPESLASSSRMSPAGIPMFYAAENLETALREIKIEEGKSAVVAEFKNSIELRVIDLTRLPSIPDIFDQYDVAEETGIRFINDFKRDFVKVINKDGKEHIEYVPTQVVSEYIKYNDDKFDGEVHGFAYPSSVTGDKAYCLFLDRYQCGVIKEGFFSNEESFVVDIVSDSIKKIVR